MADETTDGQRHQGPRRACRDRQVMLINSEQQAQALGRPVLGGYIEQTAPEPEGRQPRS